ncbi:MAG: 16S rRNA (cytidine(1402)-2'-O)-methyltransferase [Acidimicrobiales bacterium]
MTGPPGEQPASGRETGGRIVLVATPIGNLGDLSPRAVAVLDQADVVCCEDTRRTRVLLTAAGVAGRGRLVALHEHNESERIPQVLDRVGAGDTVAVVCDAGTPAISDPGARLVAAAAAEGMVVSVVPGPSAVLAALVVSGLPTERFCVEGFLPRKGIDRRRRLAVLASEERTAVVLESPARLAATLADLAQACGDRPVAVVRELTKLHEETWRGRLTAAAATFADRPARGEVVVVLGGAPPPGAPSADAVADAVADRLAAGDGVRDAADAVAGTLGVPRRRAYQAALALRDGSVTRSAGSSD